MKKGPVPNRGEALAFISASLKELQALRGGSRVLSRRLTSALDAHGGCGGFTWVTAKPNRCFLVQGTKTFNRCEEKA